MILEIMSLDEFKIGNKERDILELFKKNELFLGWRGGIKIIIY